MPVSSAASASSSAQHRLGAHTARVLLLWAGATFLTWMLARLGAHDTPASPWAGASPSWSEHVSFWDAGWYERIATEGYPHVLPTDGAGRVAPNTWAFLPLHVWLSELIQITGLAFAAAATVVSLVSSATAAVIYDRWLGSRVGTRASWWAVAFVWCSPVAFVLQTPYAESLGLALVGGALWLARQNRWGAAGACVAAACLCRPVGVPLALAFGLWWLWETANSRGWCECWRAWWLGTWQPMTTALGHSPVHSPGVCVPCACLSSKQRRQLALLTAWSVVCATVWPVAAWVVTSRPDAYTATETAWRGQDLVPMQPWWDRAGWWVGPHLGPVLLLVIVALTFLGLSSRTLRHLDPLAWWWCVGYVVYLAAVFDPTTSIVRLLLPLAPAAWALAARLPLRARLVVVLACVMGQAWWISWVWDLGSVSIQWVP